MAPPVKKLEEKFSPLLTLPDDKREFINNLIFVENKITEAIKVLQQDYGIYQNYKPDTLRIYLHKYKKEAKDHWHKFHLGQTVHHSQELPEELKKDLPAAIGDPKIMKWVPYAQVKVLLAEALTKFDSMNELERLALIQYDRVSKVLENEKNLPTEYKDKQGVTRYVTGLSKEGRYEIELLNRMFTNIITLQMDLGIRHKVEKPQNHLHIDLNTQHQQLISDFETMRKLTSVTAEALEMMTANTRGTTPTALEGTFESDQDQ
jgi:hypothetical protein